MVQDYKDRALVRQADARTTRILRKVPLSIRKRLSSTRKPKSYTKKELLGGKVLKLFQKHDKQKKLQELQDQIKIQMILPKLLPKLCAL